MELERATTDSPTEGCAAVALGLVRDRCSDGQLSPFPSASQITCGMELETGAIFGKPNNVSCAEGSRGSPQHLAGEGKP